MVGEDGNRFWLNISIDQTADSVDQRSDSRFGAV